MGKGVGQPCRNGRAGVGGPRSHSVHSPAGRALTLLPLASLPGALSSRAPAPSAESLRILWNSCPAPCPAPSPHKLHLFCTCSDLSAPHLELFPKLLPWTHCSKSLPSCPVSTGSSDVVLSKTTEQVGSSLPRVLHGSLVPSGKRSSTTVGLLRTLHLQHSVGMFPPPQFSDSTAYTPVSPFRLEATVMFKVNADK